MKRWAMAVACVLAAVLAGCASGPPRRVSEPAASIQQLTVAADGGWTVALRLQNYSSMPMRFDGVRLSLTIGGIAAGTLEAAPALVIGPGVADIVELRLQPGSEARVLMADVFATRRNVAYTLDGTLDATPVDRGGVRNTRFKRDNALSPVPGLPGVLR